MFVGPEGVRRYSNPEQSKLLQIFMGAQSLSYALRDGEGTVLIYKSKLGTSAFHTIVSIQAHTELLNSMKPVSA